MITVRENKGVFGSFILDHRIEPRDVSAVSFDAFVFKLLACVSEMVSVLEEGEDLRSLDWETSMLEEAARALQLAMFQAGLNPPYAFDTTVLPEGKSLVAFLYDEEHVPDLGKEGLQDVFRDLAIDACALCGGMLGEKELVEKFELCLRDFIAFASAYVKEEQMEEWFYG